MSVTYRAAVPAVLAPTLPTCTSGPRARARGAARAARAPAARSGGSSRSAAGTPGGSAATAYRRRPAAVAHPRPDQRQRLDRPDERVPLEQLPFDPQQAVELVRVERAEPAPEDEVLRRRDGRDRVELQEAEVPHRLQHVARGAVEQLRPDGDAPRLVETHRAIHPGHRTRARAGARRSRGCARPPRCRRCPLG